MDGGAHITRTSLPILLLAAAAIATPAWLPGAAASGSKRHCEHLTHVLASGAELVAFEKGPVDNRSIGVCDRTSGHVRDLAGGTDYFFRPPGRAVAISGRLVGFAAQEQNDGVSERNDFTVLMIADLRHLHPISNDGRFGLLVYLPDFVDIGSLDITQQRQVAWIQCPDSSGHATGNERPNCIHAGAEDSVQTLTGPKTSERKPVMVARGTTIDPLSLRIIRSRITWLQGGRRRSAPIPTG